MVGGCDGTLLGKPKPIPQAFLEGKEEKISSPLTPK